MKTASMKDVRCVVYILMFSLMTQTFVLYSLRGWISAHDLQSVVKTCCLSSRVLHCHLLKRSWCSLGKARLELCH